MDNSNPGKRYRRSLWIVVIVIFVGVTIYTLAGNHTASVACQVDSGILGIGSNAHAIYIQLSDIVDVSLLDSIEVTEEVDADTSTEDVYSGIFYEGTYGLCTIMAYKNAPVFILIRCTDETVILSLPTKKLTQRAYEDIIGAL